MKKMLGFTVAMVVANAIGNALAYEIVLKRFMQKDNLKKFTKASIEVSEELFNDVFEGGEES